jgi:oligopeptide/dipeptide ABC transporter ATP-binding protein
MTSDRVPQPVLEARGLTKVFRHRGSRDAVTALDDVTLVLGKGESIGLVGESGSGKTTLGRCLVRLIEPTAGQVLLDGRDVTKISGAELRRLRRQVQMVFQDSYDSLNPRWRVRDLIAEPLVLHEQMSGEERLERVSHLLKLVNLDDRYLGRYPHQLSGGQQQRVGVARALATEPRVLVLDEPTSAADWLTRRAILDLLKELRYRLGLVYIFISHDLGAVRSVCDRIAVMYLGRIVEEAPTTSLFTSPQHPYTRALLSAVLDPTGGRRRLRVRLAGEPPSPIDPPSGCPLHPRCPIALTQCAELPQDLTPIAPGHHVACWRVHRDEAISWPHDWQQTLPASTLP